MNKIICLTLLLWVIPFTVHADEQISDSKKALISILLEQTGQTSTDIGKQFGKLFIQQMTSMLKSSGSDVDPRAFQIIEEEVIALMQEELVVNGAFRKLMYPIYAKHFDESELEEMIKLNKTELGQKIIRIMPLLSQEGMMAGQLFAEALTPKLEERLRARFEVEGIR